MNLCYFYVVEKWTPIVLILDHTLQVPCMLIVVDCNILVITFDFKSKSNKFLN